MLALAVLCVCTLVSQIVFISGSYDSFVVLINQWNKSESRARHSLDYISDW